MLYDKRGTASDDAKRKTVEGWMKKMGGRSLGMRPGDDWGYFGEGRLGVRWRRQLSGFTGQAIEGEERRGRWTLGMRKRGS